MELHSAPPAPRLQRVRDGELDAAFVRGGDRSPGLDLIPVWRDELVAALPASHPLAARESVEIADLTAMPLRIAPRHTNPHLVDLIIGACRDAGFEPVMGPAFTTDQDTLAAIGSSKPTWTVFYSSKAAILCVTRTTFRPFAPPAPALQTYLAVRPATSARRLAPFWTPAALRNPDRNPGTSHGDAAVRRVLQPRIRRPENALVIRLTARSSAISRRPGDPPAEGGSRESRCPRVRDPLPAGVTAWHARLVFRRRPVRRGVRWPLWSGRSRGRRHRSA